MMKAALLVCYFATWAFIPPLLLLKKRPSATLAWLWAIIFIPIIGAAAYFAIGTDRLKRGGSSGAAFSPPGPCASARNPARRMTPRQG